MLVPFEACIGVVGLSAEESGWFSGGMLAGAFLVAVIVAIIFWFGSFEVQNGWAIWIGAIGSGVGGIGAAVAAGISLRSLVVSERERTQDRRARTLNEKIDLQGIVQIYREDFVEKQHFIQGLINTVENSIYPPGQRHTDDGIIAALKGLREGYIAPGERLEAINVALGVSSLSPTALVEAKASLHAYSQDIFAIEVGVQKILNEAYQDFSKFGAHRIP